MTFILNVVCNVQLKSNKACAFKRVQGTAGGVDLMIMDIQEGLPVPMVSSPSTSIPDWNSEDKNYGNTDSNFFALDPKLVPKIGNLKFGNRKIRETG
jgi:hypothetical protein